MLLQTHARNLARDDAERTAAEIKAYMATRDELLRGAKLAKRTAQRHPAGSNDWAHNRRLHDRMMELADACVWAARDCDVSRRAVRAYRECGL